MQRMNPFWALSAFDEVWRASLSTPPSTMNLSQIDHGEDYVLD